MKTYVAEINGEAILAFRAEDDHDAHQIVNEEDGGVQVGLNGFSGLLRENGDVLWDEQTVIKTRLATKDEHERWLKARDAETGSAYEGKQIDPDFHDDPNELMVYLIPTRAVDDDDNDNEEDEEDENSADLIFTHFPPNDHAPEEDFQINGNSDRGDAWLAGNEPESSKPDPDSEMAEIPPGNLLVRSKDEFERLAEKAVAEGLIIERQ
jgi:hypothetical protein